jgi:hypothetical protein
VLPFDEILTALLDEIADCSRWSIPDRGDGKVIQQDIQYLHSLRSCSAKDGAMAHGGLPRLNFRPARAERFRVEGRDQ